jgi:hypothetical protein
LSPAAVTYGLPAPAFSQRQPPKDNTTDDRTTMKDSTSSSTTIRPTSPCAIGRQGETPMPMGTGSIWLGSLLRLAVAAGLILLDNVVAVVGIFLLLVDLSFIYTWYQLVFDEFDLPYA